MATLIAVYSSSGLVGRCDAKCYEAIHPDCECICGGRNHGKGRTQAVANTREMAAAWIAAYTQEKELTDFSTEIHAECQQVTLWEGLL